LVLGALEVLSLGGQDSIVQGIAVFLSLFETDRTVRRVFCPPKELYDGKPCAADPCGIVLQPFEELIDRGAVVGLNFPWP